jgi:hypothetical protein
MKPVVDFFSGIGRGIRNAINKIWDFVLSIIEKIPDALLPSSLEKLKRSRAKVSIGPAISSALSVVNQVLKPKSATPPAPASTATPAATEAGARTRSLDRLESTLRSSMSRSGGSGARQSIVLKLQVDGETIAHATHNADRDEANRTYSSVPAY